MAFERQVWEDSLIDNFHEISVLETITTAPTDVTASSVTFNRMGTSTISDYDGTIEWEAVADSSVIMTFDCRKYIAKKVDDVEQAQSNVDIIDGVMREQALAISEKTDAYAYDKFIAGAGTTTTATITDANDMYDAIVDLGATLGKNKVPVYDRYVILGWDAIGYLNKDTRFGYNYEVLENGLITGAKVNGMTIVVSANIPDGTVIALHKSAVGFAQQIDKLETLRLQDSFGEGVRTLSVAAATVLNSDGVAVLTYTVE